MAEEKIKRLRDVFLNDIMKDFFAEQESLKTFKSRSEKESIINLIGITMQMESTLQEMCELGISGANIRGVQSQDFEKAMEQLMETSKELRDNLAQQNMAKALFLVSQFQMLQRKVLRLVANILSPNPLYEFSEFERSKAHGRNIFIVHGKDDLPKLELARLLQKLGFNPIILSEQADRGRTIIEKLEQETFDVGYAFVILTPDDIGMDKASYEKLLAQEKPQGTNSCCRARQNVILELGYLVGKIGRDRVCCLYKGNIELPSDIHGVLYKKFNESINECYKSIFDELKDAGYEIKI